MPENKYTVTFKKPYEFEGQTYKEIDLSNIENLKNTDLEDADRIFISSGQMAMVPEANVGYACILASKVTNKPIEFYKNLPAYEGIKIKNMVAGFLNG